MEKKKSALTAAVIFGVGLAAMPAYSQSTPGGKSVPSDLDRTPTTPGREQQLPPSGREIPKGTSGVMDDKTRAAIRAFQKSEGLTMTGTVDEKTAQALGVSSKSSSGSGASGSRGSSGAAGSSGSSGATGGGASGRSSGSSGSTDKSPSR